MPVTLAFDMADPEQAAAGVAAGVAALRRGELVAVPLDSGYALVADAFNDGGISALRSARGRPALRPQVLVGRLRAVAGIAEVSDPATVLMTDHWPGLLTLLLRAHPSLSWQVAAPGGPVAVRMPMHPLALRLAQELGPLAAVPAGPPGAPALESPDEIRVGLPGVARVILDGGQVPRLAESTVVDVTVRPPQQVREGAVSLALLQASCPELGQPPQRAGIANLDPPHRPAT